MKFYILSIFIVFLFISALSCQSKKADIHIPAYIIDEVSQISSTPDSLLTLEQKELKMKIFEIMKTSLKLENNKIVNRSKVRDFEKQGLSKYYYYLLEKNIEEVNNFELKDKSIGDIYSDLFKEFNRLR
jgi:hypothetical protein